MHKILNKNNKITLISVKFKKLKKKQILSICKLKNSYWNWTLKNQKNWFTKYIKNSDTCILLYVNTNLVGYTCLRKRKVFIDNVSLNYWYLDSFIIHKNWRGEELAKILILYNNNYINKSKYSSFLTCQNNLVSFYSKFGWKILSKGKYKILNHKPIWFTNNKSINGMTYNLDKIYKKNILYSIDD